MQKRLTAALTLSLIWQVSKDPRYFTSTEVLHRLVEFTQYASVAFKNRLKDDRIMQSMIDKGNCYDNAAVESFSLTLKIEEVEGADYETRQQARTGIFSHFGSFYNTKRRHSSLGCLSPNDFGRVHFTNAA